MAQWRVEVARGPLTEQVRADVEALVDAAALADGAKPLSDGALLASPPAARHVLAWPPGSGALVGYAHVEPATWTAEFVVAPDSRAQGLGTLLARQVIALGATGRAHADLPAARALAYAFGMQVERRLLLMTRSTAAATPQATPAGFLVRPYAGPSDDAALLAVNAAAFVDLPDQGGWTAGDLDARTGATWFRPADLLLLVDTAAAGGARLTDGRLAGFHWTKVHPDGSGEVYVIGLDPSYQGRGLGSPLTIAGLTHLAGRGCREVGLFVDATNAPGLALYRHLGFATVRQDVLYRLADR